MSKILVYGGQGNIRLQDLIRLSQSAAGRDILEKLKFTNTQSHTYFQSILKNEILLSDNYASMLGTFIYNLWRTSEYKLSDITCFSSHSAGIFNVLLASDSASFENIVTFIEKRAALVNSLKCKEEMWLVATSSMERLREVIDGISFVELAITTDSTTGVLSFSEENRDRFVDRVESADLLIKLKKLGLKVPYHTKFLQPIKEEYIQLVKILDIQQNNAFKYIYMSSNLEEEIINQLTQEFKWHRILEELVKKGLSIEDLSPNRFILKQVKLLNLKKN
ncbi:MULTISPECIES: CylD [Lactococcus]|uniref:CylD n=1 Tax=Lactococcus TaxID=1357 RepID=UPI0020423094|nr:MULTISPECIES: CylD [Lactococcus]